MPTEYRQIPKAPLYEISKTGDIQKISNQSTILPYPLKSNHVKLLVDGERKSFLIDELVKEVWDSSAIKKEEKKIEENMSFSKTDSKLPSEMSVGTSKPTNLSSDQIMKMDCKMSIKIWKLYEAGLKEDEIKKIVKHPHSVSVHDTIERYKNKPSLRERANLVVG